MSINNLAMLYREQGNYAEAEPLFKRALSIRRNTLAPDHPDIATSISNLALLYYDQGNYVEAEPLFKLALRTSEKTLEPDHPDYAISINNLAMLYRELGNYTQAEQLFKHALSIKEKTLGPNHPGTAMSINNLAMLYREQGSYAEAELLCKRAFRIFENTLGPNHRDTAMSINNLAMLYREQGNYADAGPLVRRAFKIFEQKLGPEHPDTATSLNNLAMHYYSQGNYAEAEALQNRALSIRVKALGPENLATAQSLNNLALIYSHQDYYAESEAFYKRALKIIESSLHTEHPFTATILTNLAVLNSDQGKHFEAEALYERALSIYMKTQTMEHPYYVLSLDSLGRTYTATLRTDEALLLFQQAYQIRRKLTEQIFSYTTERERMAFAATLEPYGSFALLDSSPDLALALLQFKGCVLDSVIEDRERIAASSDPVVQELYNRGLTLRATHDRLEGDDVTTAAHREELQDEMDAIEKELSRHVTSLGNARRAFEVTPAMVTEALTGDTALIEYIRYFRPDLEDQSQPADHYGAVIYPSAESGMAPVWIPLGEAETIDKSVTLYKHFVRGVGRESDLQKLFSLLIEPLLEALPDETQTLILSPDSELNFVSFATLLDADKKFLNERFDLRYVSSGRDLVLDRDRAGTASAQLAAVGNPSFDGSKPASESELLLADAATGPRIRSLDVRELRNLNLLPLPGAEAEVRFLAAQADGWGLSALTFINEAATEAQVRALRSPRILHLATHGFFLPEPERPKRDLSLTQIQMSGDDDSFGIQKRPPLTNPMHRSGLAFVGAKTTLDAWGMGSFPPSEDDGILTADEVGLLQLDGTWLVVLSACDTGTGEARAGQGVLGLRRGFMYSGAKNLMLTLWPVEDDYTRQFMEQFYTQALQDGDAANTLFGYQKAEMLRLRAEKDIASAVRLAGPFVLNNNETL